MRTRQNLAVRVDAPVEMNLRSDALTAFLFRAAQVMLLNVVKHSGVTEATVSAKRRGRFVRLCVSDQGRGFDPKGLAESTGFGLLCPAGPLRADPGLSMAGFGLHTARPLPGAHPDAVWFLFPNPVGEGFAHDTIAGTCDSGVRGNDGLHGLAGTGRIRADG